MACMCRALFDLSATHAGALPVRQGEKFLILKEANSDNPHWWYAVNGLGEMGYVPKNYVNIEEVSNECLQQEIDDLLDLLHSIPNPTLKHRNLLKSIVKVRSGLGKESLPPEIPKRKSQAPLPPVPIVSATESNCINNGNTPATMPGPVPNPPTQSVTSSSPPDNCFNHISNLILPNVLENETVENINSLNHNDASIDVYDASGAADVNSKTSVRSSDASLVTITEESLSEELVRSGSKSDFENSRCRPEVLFLCSDVGVQTLEAEFSIPPVLVPEMVDHVRSQTRLSYNTSIVAVATAMETLKIYLPHLSTVCDNVAKGLAQLKVAGSNSQVFESRDRERLLSVFQQLWSCKEDSEQRSWPLQEDEEHILEQLSQLKLLLVDADSRVCCEVIQLENYECVHTLVTYYQMEARRRLRLAVLMVLELMCCLDIQVVEQLLSSVLPTELVLDILNHHSDAERFMVTARMLSCVFCTGQPPPRAIYGHLNKSFAKWVLDDLESLLEGKIVEDVADHDLCILLALNLHLVRPEENFILDAVRERQSAPAALTEKLMLLINREEDPVILPIAASCIQVPNSVLKFLLDLFSDPNCAQHFYVNDIKVLLDIIVRQLTDLPAGTKRRLDYLRLAKYILTNTCYTEHKHQRAGLAYSLESLLEHEDFPQEEKDFAQSFISEFPHLFTFA